MAEKTKKGKKNASVFSMISPADYRYKVERLESHFSEDGFIKAKSRVEVALADTLADRGIVSKDAVARIEAAAAKVTTRAVYREEDRIRHDVIAQTNVIKRRLRGKENDEARRAVHRPATSYDIIDAANAMRYQAAFKEVIIPDMISLERTWIKMVTDHSDVLQIGRTHLQHAEPITFGFAMASFVSRFGKQIIQVRNAVDGLDAKFSGAVGTYAAAGLFVEDPEQFEKDVLRKLGLKPTEISTQITQQESILNLNHAITGAFGIMTNWAYNMYILEMPEVAEISQPGRGKDVSRSSMMPHKANPIGLENVISLWKEAMPHMITNYMDQISLFSRDLTNSATSRFTPEVYDIFDYAVTRADRVAKSLVPNVGNMKRNFGLEAKYIVSGPLQLLLANYGHPNAHKEVGILADAAREKGVSLMEVAGKRRGLAKFLRQFTPAQSEVLADPSKYTGRAKNKAEEVAKTWTSKMNALEYSMKNPPGG